MSLTACGGGRSASGGNDQDLAVSQVGPSSVAAGTTATFTALVVNAGRNNADNETALALAAVKEMSRPTAPSNDRDNNPKAFPQ